MTETDPYLAYPYKLEIGGVAQGHFSECSDLSLNTESIQYREAGSNQIVRHIPGPVEYAAVTLKYGLTQSSEMWDWMMKVAEGNVLRRSVSIVLLDNQGVSEVMRWNLVDAWPSEWQGAALNALEKGIAIESLTLVFDSLERA
jgi:phage tail-like protein